MLRDETPLARTGRALILVENLPVPTDRRVWLEARALARAGWELHVVCPTGAERDREPYLELEGVHIHRYPHRDATGGPWGYVAEYGSALRHMRRLVGRLVRRAAVDVVHVCNPPDVLFLATGPARRRGAALLFDHHDLVPELYAARFPSGGALLRRAAILAERLTFHRADVVVSPNETYKRIALDRGGKRAEDVFVVRIAPDPSRFSPVAPDERLKRGKEHLLAYVGEIGPQDGVDHALRALAILRGRRPDWHAVFAGTGDSVPGLVALAEELGLTEDVEFPGFLNDAEVVRLLSTADVCLSPEPRNPLNDASTMIKVTEYTALGKPIVAFDLTETRYSADGAALYAQPNDDASYAAQIERLLEQPTLRAELGAAGRRRAAELSWEQSERTLLAAYERALAASRRRPGRS